MKTILLTLLFFAVVLFVTVECRRSGAENGKKPKSGKGGIGKLRKQGKRHYNRFIFFGCIKVNSSLFYFLEILIVFEMQRLLASVLHSALSQLLC